MAKTSRVVVPQVRNVSDVRSTPRTPTLIHLSAAQWAGAIKGAVETSSLPKKQSYLEYKPTPDGGGVVMPSCGTGNPDEICSVRPRVGPGGVMSWECRCKSRRSPGDGGFQVVPAGTCEFVLDTGPRPRFRCQSNGCTGNCRFLIVRDGGRFLLTCACQ